MKSIFDHDVNNVTISSPKPTKLSKYLDMNSGAKNYFSQTIELEPNMKEKRKLQNPTTLDLSIVERLSGDPIRQVHDSRVKTRTKREQTVKSVMLNSSSELNVTKNRL